MHAKRKDLLHYKSIFSEKKLNQAAAVFIAEKIELRDKLQALINQEDQELLDQKLKNRSEQLISFIIKKTHSLKYRLLTQFYYLSRFSGLFPKFACF